MAYDFSRDDMLEMDPALLRMHLRERTHHQVEFPVYAALFQGRMPGKRVGESARDALEVWMQRGLPVEGDDLMWARTMDRLLAQLKEGTLSGPDEVEGLSSPEPLGPDQVDVVETLISARRSCRRWTDDPVDLLLVERILNAGMWAPSTCNYQSLRFIVVTRRDELERLPNQEFGTERVKIIACSDTRPWTDAAYPLPEKNRYLEVGAAMQNMLLVAHAHGLGACWSTFEETQIEKIRQFYSLEEYIEVITYMSIGWPGEAVLQSGRMSVDETVLNDWKCA